MRSVAFSTPPGLRRWRTSTTVPMCWRLCPQHSGSSWPTATTRPKRSSEPSTPASTPTPSPPSPARSSVPSTVPTRPARDEVDVNPPTMPSDRSLDRSDDTIGGFNTFLDEQRQLPGECRVTLVQFDGQDPQEVVLDAAPIAGAPNLDADTYRPRGSTPLLDAVRAVVDRIDARVVVKTATRTPAGVEPAKRSVSSSAAAATTAGPSSSSAPTSTPSTKPASSASRHPKADDEPKAVYAVARPPTCVGCPAGRRRSGRRTSSSTRCDASARPRAGSEQRTARS